MTQEPTVEVEVHIRARPETVFSFFIEPARYRLWHGEEAQLEPWPGGLYRVVMATRDVARGQYVEVDPPRRLVFSWGFEGNPALPPGTTTVEVTFDPDPEPGTTLLRLRHRGLPDEDTRAMHRAGWRDFLDRLAIVTTGGDWGPAREDT